MINGIWDDPYVQELGIIDHCTEVIELKNKTRAMKSYTNTPSKSMVEDLSISLNKEMMDLYLILEKWAHDKESLKLIRLARFEEKKRKS